MQYSQPLQCLPLFSGVQNFPSRHACTRVHQSHSHGVGKSARLGNKATSAELFVACNCGTEKHGLAQVHDVIDNENACCSTNICPLQLETSGTFTLLANIPSPSLPTHNETLSIPPHYSHEIMYQQQNAGQESGKKTICLSCSQLHISHCLLAVCKGRTDLA